MSPIRILKNIRNTEQLKSSLKLFVSKVKKKCAFTLAEVLITLGIIGVVAAMTIPSLMTKINERRTISKLKQTYSILGQAIKLISTENGAPDGWGLSGKETEADAKIAGEMFRPYLVNTIDCGTNDTKEICFSNSYVQKLKGGNNTQDGKLATRRDTYKFKLPNGVSIGIRPKSFGTMSETNDGTKILQITVDVNGTLPPNTMGRDLFQFMWYSDQELAAHGAPNSSVDYNKTCTMLGGSGTYAGTGNGCAYYIMTFGNMDYLRKK